MPELTKGVVLESYRCEIGNKGHLQVVVDEKNHKWLLVNDLRGIFGPQFQEWYVIEKGDLVEKVFPMLKQGKSADYWFISVDSVRHMLENPKTWYWDWLRSDG